MTATATNNLPDLFPGTRIPRSIMNLAITYILRIDNEVRKTGEAKLLEFVWKNRTIGVSINPDQGWKECSRNFAQYAHNAYLQDPSLYSEPAQICVTDI